MDRYTEAISTELNGMRDGLEDIRFALENFPSSEEGDWMVEQSAGELEDRVTRLKKLLGIL